MNRKILIIVVMLLGSANLNLFGMKIFESVVSSDGFQIQSEYGQLTIMENGVVYFEEQQYSLFDCADIGIYEAGLYLGAVLEKHFFAYMAIDVAGGVAYYVLIVNHIDEEVVHFWDAESRKGGLHYLVPIEDKVLLLNGISISCFFIGTEKIVWRYDWSDNYTNNSRLISYAIAKDTVYVKASGIPELVFDIDTGQLR